MLTVWLAQTEFKSLFDLDYLFDYTQATSRHRIQSITERQVQAK